MSDLPNTQRSDRLTTKGLRAYVAASRASQGLPPKVTDPVVIQRIVDLVVLPASLTVGERGWCRACVSVPEQQSRGRPRGNDEGQRTRRGLGADRTTAFRDPEFPAGRWLRTPTPGGWPDPIVRAASW